MLQQIQINIKTLQNNRVQFYRFVAAIHSLNELETFDNDLWAYTSELLDVTYCPLLASVN